ncbi:MAG: CO dehydrogenase/acetyl-CoA synthase complex subunit epsilon [Candidatus Jordarchaeaceae archaeon]
MMAAKAPTPWQSANWGGSKNASVLMSGQVAAKMIKKKKRCLLIVSANAIRELDGKRLVDYAVEIGKAGIPVVATANMVKELRSAGFDKAVDMQLADITNRLRDSKWKGLDGKGHYDCVIYLGGIYYIQSQSLSTLKHFAPNILTISLDREYQPNASFSFNNLKPSEWKKELDDLVAELKA